MRLSKENKKRIDDYFDSRTPEEIYYISIKCGMSEIDAKLRLNVVSGTFNGKNIPTFDDWLYNFKEVGADLYKFDEYTYLCSNAMYSKYKKEFNIEP